MTRRGITHCLLSIVLAIFLIVTVLFANRMAAEAPCRAVAITVEDNAMARFVTPDDINSELSDIRSAAETMLASQVNLRQIEDKLRAIPNIETANCYRRGDDVISIDVVPMVPVARIFDSHGSYYVNADGKRLTANRSYRIDAPVVEGDFDGHEQELVPLVRLIAQITADPSWNALVSSVKVDPRSRDIILVPSFTGHLINFGDAGAAPDKFKRLAAFYRKVLPVKGWNHYDTISVKFAGQVVGHIAPGQAAARVNQYAHEDFDEEISIDAMTAETINPSDIKPKL